MPLRYGDAARTLGAEDAQGSVVVPPAEVLVDAGEISPAEVLERGRDLWLRFRRHEGVERQLLAAICGGAEVAEHGRLLDAALTGDVADRLPGAEAAQRIVLRVT